MTNAPTDKSATPPSTSSSPKKGSDLINDQLDPNPTRDRTFILGREEEATEKDKDESKSPQNGVPQSSSDIGLSWRRETAKEIQAQYPGSTVEEIEEMLD